jgi:paraquat-inducible protein B
MSVKATVDQLNGNAVQPTTEKAKNVASNTVATVAAFIEDVLLPNLGRTQALLLAGLALAQEILKRNRKRAEKNVSNVQESVASTTKTGLNKAQDVAQSGLSTAKSALQSGLSTVQDAAQSGLDTAQDVLQKSVKSARKDLKKAQRTMKVARKAAAVGSTVAVSKAQDVLQSGLDTTQDALQKNVRRASKSLQKAGESMQDVGETVQHKTSRFFFRVGIVTGLVLILLYTPWPGSETRAKLANLFQQARQNLAFMSSGS